MFVRTVGAGFFFLNRGNMCCFFNRLTIMIHERYCVIRFI